LTWESRNTGASSAQTLYAASGGAFIEGVTGPMTSQFAQVATKALSAGTETAVLSLRADTVFANRASMGQATLVLSSVAADGTKSVEVRLYKNSTLTSAQFVAVNAVSCVSYDNSATAASGGILVFAFTVAKTGDLTQALDMLSILLQAGETLTVTAKSSNTSDVTVALAWYEDV
jgi:hypothetical protein